MNFGNLHYLLLHNFFDKYLVKINVNKKSKKKKNKQTKEIAYSMARNSRTACLQRLNLD